MENFLFLFRIAGSVVFFAGVLLVISITWWLYRRDTKNNLKAERIFKQIQKNGLKDGAYEIENVRVVVEKDEQNKEVAVKFSFPVSDEFETKLSSLSFHCMLSGALLFAGGTIGWFENKELWILLLLCCPAVPFITLWVCVFVIKLLRILVYFLQLLVASILLFCFQLVLFLARWFFRLKRA